MALATGLEAFMTHVPDTRLSISPPPRRVSNRMGQAGLLLGVCGLLLFWIPMVYPAVGIIAITLSGIAYSQVRAGTATNGKSAILGLVLGILAIVLPIVVLLSFAFLAAGAP